LKAGQREMVVEPEVYFLRYAFPCARVLVDLRKTLTEEEFSEMQRCVETDTPMDRKFLESKFTKAVEGMKKIDKDFWNIDTIRRYFWSEHEGNLSKDLPPTICRLCIVRPGRLTRKIDNVFRAEIKDGLGKEDVRIVVPLYKDAKVGDTAMIHYGYAVERLED